MPRRRWLFLYDGDCGVCQAVVDRLAASAGGRGVEWRAWQHEPSLPSGVGVHELERAAWLQRGDGSWVSGFDAFRWLSLRITLLWILLPLFWMPGSAVIGRRIYAAIARRRADLSRRLGLTACRVPRRRHGKSD